MPNYQQWRIYSVPPVSASLEIQSFAGIFPLHFFHLHSPQASTANTTGPKLGHLRSASFFLIPCRLVTSPLTQARSLTPPLQLFLAHSFNQPDTGLHSTSLRTTFQMKEGAQHHSCCISRDCTCPGHPRWIPALELWFSLPPDGRWSSTPCKRTLLSVQPLFFNTSTSFWVPLLGGRGQDNILFDRQRSSPKLSIQSPGLCPKCSQQWHHVEPVNMQNLKLYPTSLWLSWTSKEGLVRCLVCPGYLSSQGKLGFLPDFYLLGMLHQTLRILQNPIQLSGHPAQPQYAAGHKYFNDWTIYQLINAKFSWGPAESQVLKRMQSGRLNECWRQLETVAQKSKERWASNILMSLVTILRMQWWTVEVIQVSDGEDGYRPNHGGGWHLRDILKKAEKGRGTQWKGTKTGVMELQRNGWIWHLIIDTFDNWVGGWDQERIRDVTDDSCTISLSLVAKRLQASGRSTFAEYLLSARHHKLTLGL